MKQKAAMARALALQPKVLLMDEPFGSLDALTRLALQDLLLKIWQETGVTIVLVTHDLPEAIKLADRIAVLGGRGAAGLKEIIANRLARPRVIGGAGYGQIYAQIYALLDMTAKE